MLGRASYPASSSWGTSEPRLLAQFLRWLTAAAVVFGTGEILAGLIIRERALLIVGIATWTFLLSAVPALIAERHRRPQLAVILVYGGVLPISTVALVAVPEVFAAVVILWLVTLALSLPYLEGAWLSVLFGVGLLWIASATAFHEFVLSDHRLRFATVLPVIATPTIAAFALLLLTQFRTRLTRTLSETRAAEERHRLIVDSALDAVITMDERGVITDWNPQAERTFGWSAQEALGRDLAEIIIPVIHHEAHRRGLQSYLETGDGAVIDRRIEVTARHRDEHEFPVELSISATRRDDAVIFTGFVRDITDRRRMEREQQQLTELLVLAQDEERHRIADSIHDDPVQKMTAVGIRIAGLRQQLNDPEQLESIDRLEGSVVDAVGRLRRLMFELHPRSLDREGVASALREYLSGAEPSLEFTVDDRTDVQLSDERRIVVYRIAQEALANVTKHAEASRVDILMASEQGGLMVTVVDDGVGFDPGSVVTSRHVGLVTMRERAELSGGWWKIESSPGAGTTITFWVPAEVPRS